MSQMLGASAGSEITAELRSALLQGQWSPSQRLQPAKIAAEFGVSTTVIRETLTRLAGEGLVVVQRNRGFFVPALTLRELADLTELRCASEEIAVRLSLQRGDLAWESALMAAHHRLARTPRRDQNDPMRISDAWTHAHREFHTALIGACECEAMITLSENLAAKTELYRRWSAPSKAAMERDVEQEHRELLDAALRRDVPATSELLAEHYRRTVRIVIDAGLAPTH